MVPPPTLIQVHNGSENGTKTHDETDHKLWKQCLPTGFVKALEVLALKTQDVLAEKWDGLKVFISYLLYIASYSSWDLVS
jgi:hypothetical protein